MRDTEVRPSLFDGQPIDRSWAADIGLLGHFDEELARRRSVELKLAVRRLEVVIALVSGIERLIVVLTEQLTGRIVNLNQRVDRRADETLSDDLKPDFLLGVEFDAIPIGIAGLIESSVDADRPREQRRLRTIVVRFGFDDL